MSSRERITRRPIPSRGAAWAIAAARGLRRAGVRPNQVSVFGVVFGAASGGCLILSATAAPGWRIALLLLAAAGIPLRLLCNLLDGMLAVEGGLKTRTGELYNELPDRLADVLVLVGAGYAIRGSDWGPDLGWAAGAMALLTAYVRTLGAAAGASQHFTGPMAKPQRMHVMIAACLLAAAETALAWPPGRALTAALALVIAGSGLTIVRRLRRIVADLEAA